MTDLEQSLINEFGKLAKQYAEDQKRLSGQVERLEKQVRQLDESGTPRARKRYTDWLETMTLHQRGTPRRWAEHITKLTDAYEAQQNSFRALADAYISLEKDLTELIR